jgi:hypothetical protein
VSGTESSTVHFLGCISLVAPLVLLCSYHPHHDAVIFSSCRKLQISKSRSRLQQGLQYLQSNPTCFSLLECLVESQKQKIQNLSNYLSIVVSSKEAYQKHHTSIHKLYHTHYLMQHGSLKLVAHNNLVEVCNKYPYQPKTDEFQDSSLTH